MSTSDRRETAKIYRFPRRLRAVTSFVPPGSHAAPVQLHAMCDAGSGWYHEAAVQEDLRDRKH